MQVWSEPCGDKTRALVCFGLREISTHPVWEGVWPQLSTRIYPSVKQASDCNSGERLWKKRDIFTTLLGNPGRRRLP